MLRQPRMTSLRKTVKTSTTGGRRLAEAQSRPCGGRGDHLDTPTALPWDAIVRGGPSSSVANAYGDIICCNSLCFFRRANGRIRAPDVTGMFSTKRC